MSEAAPHALTLLRFSGEIGTKAKSTRERFERRLVRNVADALASAGVPAAVQRTRNRVLVETGDTRAADALARVFGVQSLSIARVHAAENLDEVVATGTALFAGATRGRRFAVRARRVGDRGRVALDAREVERALGRALQDRGAGPVDLGAPEAVARIELHERLAYFCTDTRPGPGGLPLEVEGAAVALVSGGFDSAVAAWQLLRRGVRLDYVFCNLGGLAHELGALRVAKVIADAWSYGGHPRLHAIDFSGVAAEIRARSETRYWQVILKRQMLRAAEAVARAARADAIVTGESVGQVSSQTLANLATISQATVLPILRPLVGSSKDEIIRQAERIGTAGISATVDEYCALAPSRPATQARLDVVLAQEAALDPAVVERAVAARRVLDLRAIGPDAEALRALEIDDVPDGATVIDLRSKTGFDAWHWPGALRLDFDRALAAHASFDRSRTYVVCCEIGQKSAHLAELLQRAGMRAAYVRLRTLMERAEGGAPAALRQR